MRLIDADALEVITVKVPKGMDAKSYMTGMEYVLRKVDALPTIEERKTGKWIWKTLDVYKCSECETETHVDECMEEPIYNFCPYCGARLVQEGEDNERA